MADSGYCFGFTGTRHGMTDAQKVALRNYLNGSSGKWHHGDCKGSDDQSHDIAEEAGYEITLHPPSNPSKRAFRKVPFERMRPEKPYLERDRDIVFETTALIAAPAEFEEQPRGGTWYTVRFARKQGKPVVLIFPDGSIKQLSATSTA